MTTNLQAIVRAANGPFRKIVGPTILLLLAGCTLPGVQMDLRVPRAVEESQTRFDSADTYVIDGNTIARLNDEAKATPKRRVDPSLHANDTKPYLYLIGAGDVLRVTVWDHPELNNPGAVTGSTPAIQSYNTSPAGGVTATQTADGASRVVASDGTMFYPYVGSVAVLGKTTVQVRAFLTQALARVIKDPQVEVVVAAYRSQRVFLTGEVKTPGSVPISDVPLHISDAVTAAGGLTLAADLSEATLIRNGKPAPLDLYALLYKGDVSENILLTDGDILNIPETRFNKVFVLGEVSKPSAMLMPRGQYTLNEALADVGGISQLYAKASQVYVIRAGESREQIYQLDASKPDALLLADAFLLYPRDVIFVDATGSTRLGRIISQVLPTAQLLQAGRYSATGE